MTPSQENKLNDVHDIALRMEGKFDLIDERMKTHRELLIEHEKNILDHAKQISTLNADKNKVVGAIWLGGTGFFAMIITFIYNFFKH